MVNNATKQQGLYTMQDTEDYVVEPVNIVGSLFWPEIDFFFPQDLIMHSQMKHRVQGILVI